MEFGGGLLAPKFQRTFRSYELHMNFSKFSAKSLPEIWEDILSCNFVFQCSLKRHRRVDPPKEEFADGGLKILVACLCEKLAF